MAPRGAPPPLPQPGDRARLVAVRCREGAIQARRRGWPRALFVRPSGAGGEPALASLPVEGESFDLRVAESWRAGARCWLRGAVSRVRLDVSSLGLEPLALVRIGPRPPAARRGRSPRARAEYELERVPAGRLADAGPEAILERAIELWATDRHEAARRLLGDLLRRDLRALTAHAGLGFLAFHAPPDGGGPARAERHYDVGLAIAGLSLPRRFAGTLPWARPGNRPFLRCLYGRSICRWRRGDLRGARAGFARLCRLNPGDQLAARLAIDRIDRGPG